MPDTPNASAATDAAVALITEGGFDYALIGGLAVVLRGHDRSTQDVDALVWDLDERLETRRFHQRHIECDGCHEYAVKSNLPARECEQNLARLSASDGDLHSGLSFDQWPFVPDAKVAFDRFSRAKS